MRAPKLPLPLQFGRRDIAPSDHGVLLVPSLASISKEFFNIVFAFLLSICHNHAPLTAIKAQQNNPQMSTFSVSSAQLERTHLSPHSEHRDSLSIFFDHSYSILQNENGYFKGARALATICSYLSSIPFISPARQASSKDVLKQIFPIGEVVSWGTLYAWSSNNIISRIHQDGLIDSNRGSNERKSVSKTYWIALISLGVASQIPAAYITYNYNDGSIFWTLFSPLIYSSFTIVSMDELIQKIIHTDNCLARCIHHESQKITLFQAKENFCNLLEERALSLLDESNPNRAVTLAILSGDEPDIALETRFLKFLRDEIKNKINKIKNENIYVKRGDRFVQVTGCLLSLSRSCFDGYLVYEGTRLVLDNNYFIAFMILLSVTPSAYLGINVNRQMYSRIFKTAISCCSSVSIAGIFSRIKYLPAIFFSCFGIGATLTTLRDHISFDDPKDQLFCGAVLGTLGTILTNSMLALTDYSIQKIRSALQIVPSSEKQFQTHADKIQEFIFHMRKMSIQEFELFIERFEPNSAAVSSFIPILAKGNLPRLIHEIDKRLSERI
jgi:hypothetical protein